MNIAQIILEYLKSLIWPAVLVSALFMYRDTIGSLLKASKVKLSIFGVEIETSIANLERAMTAAVGGTLTSQQWELLTEIAKGGNVSVQDKKYSMNMQGDLQWIRPIRNAGLLVSLPDGKYIEQAEYLGLTELGRIVTQATLRQSGDR